MSTPYHKWLGGEGGADDETGKLSGGRWCHVRITPQATTGTAPTELLSGRWFRTRLPRLSQWSGENSGLIMPSRWETACTYYVEDFTASTEKLVPGVVKVTGLRCNWAMSGMSDTTWTMSKHEPWKTRTQDQQRWHHRTLNGRSFQLQPSTYLPDNNPEETGGELCYRTCYWEAPTGREVTVTAPAAPVKNWHTPCFTRMSSNTKHSTIDSPAGTDFEHTV